jgi:ABC-type lipoprotein release transport system permease subunit
MQQGARVTLLGVALDIAGAFATTGVLQSLLFDVAAFYVVTFAAMSAVMVAVALLASYLPARRASSQYPVQALREE